MFTIMNIHTTFYLLSFLLNCSYLPRSEAGIISWLKSSSGLKKNEVLGPPNKENSNGDIGLPTKQEKRNEELGLPSQGNANGGTEPPLKQNLNEGTGSPPEQNFNQGVGELPTKPYPNGVIGHPFPNAGIGHPLSNAHFGHLFPNADIGHPLPNADFGQPFPDFGQPFPDFGQPFPDFGHAGGPFPNAGMGFFNDPRFHEGFGPQFPNAGMDNFNDPRFHEAFDQQNIGYSNIQNEGSNHRLTFFEVEMKRSRENNANCKEEVSITLLAKNQKRWFELQCLENGNQSNVMEGRDGSVLVGHLETNFFAYLPRGEKFYYRINGKWKEGKFGQDIAMDKELSDSDISQVQQKIESSFPSR
ncbi:uncharacterized protein LOC129001501 isoform X1 [Macrosteles quadrilineatus]|uniref:uncharacterized protein LOC129001501 isoform X1 n=1 Tax=Macrosteles quadrilineatus TaxID=74068 RepID=UPI0023E0D33D|nr:uncharacterized protein LOC129001501 isoform X1 [Macrosteles quadrilineatus]